jgi:hypothetical protein
VEPLKRARGKSRGSTSPLQRTLDAALGQVRETFANVSLDDMLARAPKAKPSARRRKKAQPRARKRKNA